MGVRGQGAQAEEPPCPWWGPTTEEGQQDGFVAATLALMAKANPELAKDARVLTEKRGIPKPTPYHKHDRQFLAQAKHFPTEAGTSVQGYGGAAAPRETQERGGDQAPECSGGGIPSGLGREACSRGLF